MNEALLNSIVEQVDAHEIRIDELHQKAQQDVKNANAINLIQANINEMKACIQQAAYPVESIQQLSKLLEANLQLLKRPLQQEVVHHHHATKIIWATAALFLIVCLLTTSWYLTSNKLELYKANDTKYRYLKLQSNINLRQWCRSTDSLFMANENMRTIVLVQEEQKQRNIETLERAMEMEQEAKKLKDQVNRTKRNETNSLRNNSLLNKNNAIFYSVHLQYIDPVN